MSDVHKQLGHLARVWALLATLVLVALGLPGVGRHVCGANDCDSSGAAMRCYRMCAACHLASAERTGPPAPVVCVTRIFAPPQPVRQVSVHCVAPAFPVSLRGPPSLS